MNRGDVILVRFPHPSGVRGKKRPAVIIQADNYSAKLRTLVVAEITSNVSMAGDPACLFVDLNTSEGQATGLLRDSVISCLALATVRADNVETVMGRLTGGLKSKLDECLKASLDL
jgi:mRNA interferase MazF